MFRFTTIFPVCFTEPLEVNDFTGTQEADGIAYVAVVYQAQNVVIGSASLLLRCHILKQICNGIALRLEFAAVKWYPSCRHRPDPNGMIHIIVCKSGFFDLFHGKIPGQLVDNGRYHFKMGKFFCTDIRQNRCHLIIWHGIPLGNISHGSPQLAVRPAVLRHDHLGDFGVGFLDIYRKL